MTDQDEATGSSWLHRDMEWILERLVRRPEFADEINRLALTPWRVAREVAQDPAVLAGARRAYEPLEAGRRALAAHKRAEPTRWPSDWAPTPSERRALNAAVSVPAGWILLVAVFGSWLPSIAEATSFFVALAATWALARRGLPTTVGPWLRWALDHLRLMGGVPTRWWGQRQELRDEVLIPELREWLHRQMTPSFDLELRLRDAGGLTMPPGHGPLVRTAAVEACTREVNRSMPGAVGLAGARGAGKTTIVERAVLDEFTHPSRGTMLGVLTSAPVRYDARDFVLHIHTCVCRAVLDFLADSGDAAGSETQRQWYRLYRIHRLRASLSAVVRAVLRAGVVVALAVGIAALTWQWRGDGPAVWHAVTGLAHEAWVSPAAVAQRLTWRLGVAALCGILITTAAWILARGLVWPTARGTAMTLWQILRTRMARPPTDSRHTALRSVAEQHLRRIRYLQTHTEGWSGKVSAPIGSELSMTRSLARTEQPWTHPEVVARLRDFLELVVDVLGTGPAAVSGIVVAIDELDKISEPEEAHRFLNEIKGIFGVQQCLFLVSVSDDALTAFERRGIPARDAFDSAFTTMIHVQPFTLSQSGTWLAHRALGIPEPFVWLCHCLSGGLPRDLGRVAIALHDLQHEHTHLGDVTRALVHDDLSLKVRAFVHTAKQRERAENDDPDQPHRLINDLQAVATTDLLDLYELALRIWPEPERSPATELEKLRAEAACYLIFCQTLVEVFHHNLDPADLRLTPTSPDTRDSGTGAITMLALARQHMTVDTPLARSVLTDFRAKLDLCSHEESPLPGQRRR